MGENILEIKQLRKDYKQIRALNGLSIEVKKGQVFGILVGKPPIISTGLKLEFLRGFTYVLCENLGVVSRRIIFKLKHFTKVNCSVLLQHGKKFF